MGPEDRLVSGECVRYGGEVLARVHHDTFGEGRIA
jgi:hypothetical protein